MKSSLLSVSIFYALCFFPEYPVSVIHQEYQKIFSAKKITIENNTYISTEIHDLSEDHFLHDFIVENKKTITYLVHNCSPVGYQRKDWDKLIRLQEDSAHLNEYYIQSLQSSPEFNRYFLNLLNTYLIAKGSKIKDFNQIKPIILSEDELLKIASRFFYATGIDQYRICVGFDNHGDIQKLKIKKELALVEAFCYTTILDNVTKPESKIMQDFTTNIKKNNALSFKNTQDTLKILRNNMFESMYKSQVLKEILLHEYEKKKEKLNFRIHP